MKLHPCNLWVNRQKGSKAGKSAVRASNNTVTPDELGKAHDAISDQLRVFDIVCARVDHAWYQDFVVGDFRLFEHAPLVPVSGVRRFKQYRPSTGAEDNINDVTEWNIEMGGTHVVSPAHMNAQALPWDISSRVVE